MAKRKTVVIDVQYPADVITPEQRAAFDATRPKARRSVKARVDRRVKAREYPGFITTPEHQNYYDAYDTRYSLRGTDEVAFFALLPNETEAEKSARLAGYPGLLPGENDLQRLARIAQAMKEEFDRRPLSGDELIYLRKNVIT